MLSQCLVSKAAYALNIMPTIEVVAAKLLCSAGCKVSHGVAAELGSVLEDVANLLLDFECCSSCSCEEFVSFHELAGTGKGRQRTSDHRAPDTTRVQTISTNLLSQALMLKLFLQRRRRPRDRGFTRIITQTSRHIDGRGARGQIDDGAGLSLPHALQHLVDAQHGALEVDLDGAPEVLEALRRRELAVRDPRVVHQDVYRSKCLGEGRECLANPRHVGDVAFVRLDPHALIFLARGFCLFLAFYTEIQ